MLHPAFVRAGKSVRSRLGLDALFAGAHITRVPTELNVELVDGEGTVTVAQLVVKIDRELNPRAGMTLVFIDTDQVAIPNESYKLDVKLDDNGVNTRWVCVKA